MALDLQCAWWKALGGVLFILGPAMFLVLTGLTLHRHLTKGCLHYTAPPLPTFKGLKESWNTSSGCLGKPKALKQHYDSLCASGEWKSETLRARRWLFVVTDLRRLGWIYALFLLVKKAWMSGTNLLTDGKINCGLAIAIQSFDSIILLILQPFDQFSMRFDEAISGVASTVGFFCISLPVFFSFDLYIDEITTLFFLSFGTCLAAARHSFICVFQTGHVLTSAVESATSYARNVFGLDSGAGGQISDEGATMFEEEDGGFEEEAIEEAGEEVQGYVEEIELEDVDVEVAAAAAATAGLIGTAASRKNPNRPCSSHRLPSMDTEANMIPEERLQRCTADDKPLPSVPEAFNVLSMLPVEPDKWSFVLPTIREDTSLVTKTYKDARPPSQDITSSLAHPPGSTVGLFDGMSVEIPYVFNPNELTEEPTAPEPVIVELGYSSPIGGTSSRHWLSPYFNSSGGQEEELGPSGPTPNGQGFEWLERQMHALSLPTDWHDIPVVNVDSLSTPPRTPPDIPCETDVERVSKAKAMSPNLLLPPDSSPEEQRPLAKGLDVKWRNANNSHYYEGKSFKRWSGQM